MASGLMRAFSPISHGFRWKTVSAVWGNEIFNRGNFTVRAAGQGLQP